MSPVTKNLILFLFMLFMLNVFTKANATTINLGPEVKCMLKHRTRCMVC